MPTLEESIAIFLQSDRAEQTNRHYTYVLNRMSKAIGSQRDVALVTYEDLADYVYKLYNNGRKGKGVKRSTAAGYLQVIQNFFTFCVRRKYLSASPAADLYVRKSTPDPVKSRAVPPGELNAMIDCARYHKRNYAIILFLADTGCRVGGIASLTISNLDVDNLTALLLEKAARWHRAYFGERTAQALREWLTVRPETNHDYVFTVSQKRGAGPLAKLSYNSVVNKLSKESGASRIYNPHAIRHSVGHALAERGLPVSAVAAKLGHSNTAVTTAFYYPKHDDYVAAISRNLSLAAAQSPEEAKPILNLPVAKSRRQSG